MAMPKRKERPTIFTCDIVALLRDHPALTAEVERLARVEVPTAGPATAPTEQLPLPMELPSMTRRSWKRRLRNEAARKL